MREGWLGRSYVLWKPGHLMYNGDRLLNPLCSRRAVVGHSLLCHKITNCLGTQTNHDKWGSVVKAASASGVFWQLVLLGCQYQCKRLSGRTRPRNDLLCVNGDVKPYSLTHTLAAAQQRCIVEHWERCDGNYWPTALNHGSSSRPWLHSLVWPLFSANFYKIAA